MTKSLKDILARLCKRVNFRQVQVTGSSVTMTSGTTTWITVPKPSSGTPVAVIGWYFNGTGVGRLHVYSCSLQSGGAMLALGNGGTGTATFTPAVFYLVVD